MHIATAASCALPWQQERAAQSRIQLNSYRSGHGYNRTAGAVGGGGGALGHGYNRTAWALGHGYIRTAGSVGGGGPWGMGTIGQLGPWGMGTIGQLGAVGHGYKRTAEGRGSWVQ